MRGRPLNVDQAKRDRPAHTLMLLKLNDVAARLDPFKNSPPMAKRMRLEFHSAALQGGAYLAN